MSEPTELIRRGTADVIVSSGGSLSSAAAVVETSYTPTSSGYEWFQFVINMTFGTSPAGPIYLYLLVEDGSSNFESGSATGPIIPARNPDIVFPTLAQTSAQIVSRICPAPAGPCKPLIYNQAGETMSSGWTLTCIPFTPEVVTE